MLYLPERCPRERTDCEPLAQIVSDERPLTFICVGENDGSTRTEPGDCYRLCIRGAGGPAGADSIQDVDRRDLVDQVSVMAQALSIIENTQEEPAHGTT